MNISNTEVTRSYHNSSNKKYNKGFSGQPRDLFLKGLQMINNELAWLKKNPTDIKMCLRPNPHLYVDSVHVTLSLTRPRGQEGSMGDQWGMWLWWSTSAESCKAPSCSLSEVGTQRAFDRVSLCDWYTRLPPSSSSRLPNSHVNTRGQSLDQKPQNFMSTPLRQRSAVSGSHLQRHCSCGVQCLPNHSSHFRTLNPVLQRKWVQSILCCWVTVTRGGGAAFVFVGAE